MTGNSTDSTLTAATAGVDNGKDGCDSIEHQPMITTARDEENAASTAAKPTPASSTATEDDNDDEHPSELQPSSSVSERKPLKRRQRALSLAEAQNPSVETVIVKAKRAAQSLWMLLHAQVRYMCYNTLVTVCFCVSAVFISMSYYDYCVFFINFFHSHFPCY